MKRNVIFLLHGQPFLLRLHQETCFRPTVQLEGPPAPVDATTERRLV